MKMKRFLVFFCLTPEFSAADVLRDLSPDRPDTTESPVTVDAGHWQIETSVYDLSRDDGADAHGFMETNVKYGIDGATDVQLVVPPYVRDEASGAEGAGDLTVRLKRNLWGNDGGSTAFAVFPFVKIPTGTAVGNGAWGGGLILPFAMEISGGWSLGMMAEWDLIDGDSSRPDHEFVHSIVLGRDLTDQLGVFLEYVGTAAEDGCQAQASGGFTWAVNADFQLDCGCRVGLNDAAEDLGIFSGFTIRF